MAIANIKVTLLCSVEQIWDKVTDLEDFEWRSDLKEIKVIDDNNFIEVDKKGIETQFNKKEKVQYQSLVYAVENDTVKGIWTGNFYPQKEKTTLDFTEELHLKKPTRKPFMDSYRKKQKQYFKDLKEELNCDEASFKQIL